MVDRIETKFDKIGLSEKTIDAIAKMGFEAMTPIQAKSIPLLLKGANLIGAAKTGSGKTLAFLIPIFEFLAKRKRKNESTLCALIISPTRELALQIFKVAKLLGKSHDGVAIGLVMGGCNRKQEVKRLGERMDLLIATPGRLLDHLNNTKDFTARNLKMLVIDEADRILDQGFEQEMRQILAKIPRQRHTVLFSATQTKRTKDLAKLSFNSTPTYVGVSDDEQCSTRKGLIQGYVRTQEDEKFRLLLTFLNQNPGSKTIVFLSTCNATKFYCALLNLVDIPASMLHGHLKQSKRTSAFTEFVGAKQGVLLATDVAARGLDFSDVDWIIQYDPPADHKGYIHRVGRTARGLDGKGKALLFLLPSEMDYPAVLASHKVPLKENVFPRDRLLDVQDQLEKLIGENYYLAKSARKAYKSYMQAYSASTLFDVHSLDVYKLARAFGFSAPPRVSLNISLSKKKAKKRQLRPSDKEGAKGFSNDKKRTQFSR